METFDYVIIGAGSAGSVLANRLSEDSATRVCVLEAGGKDWHPYIHLPAGFKHADAGGRILAEAVGEHAARGARADDHVIERFHFFVSGAAKVTAAFR